MKIGNSRLLAYCLTKPDIYKLNPRELPKLLPKLLFNHDKEDGYPQLAEINRKLMDIHFKRTGILYYPEHVELIFKCKCLETVKLLWSNFQKENPTDAEMFFFNEKNRDESIKNAISTDSLEVLLFSQFSIHLLPKKINNGENSYPYANDIFKYYSEVLIENRITIEPFKEEILDRFLEMVSGEISLSNIVIICRLFGFNLKVLDKLHTKYQHKLNSEDFLNFNLFRKEYIQTIEIAEFYLQNPQFTTGYNPSHPSFVKYKNFIIGVIRVAVTEGNLEKLKYYSKYPKGDFDCYHIKSYFEKNFDYLLTDNSNNFQLLTRLLPCIIEANYSIKSLISKSCQNGVLPFIKYLHKMYPPQISKNSNLGSPSPTNGMNRNDNIWIHSGNVAASFGHINIVKFLHFHRPDVVFTKEAIETCLKNNANDFGVNYSRNIIPNAQNLNVQFKH
eukprot:gene10165-12471_t